jgi:hypothetical protein
MYFGKSISIYGAPKLASGDLVEVTIGHDVAQKEWE